MKKILILPLVLFFLVQGSMAQTPKWVEKAKRAVFSVVTYDKNDKMLNTGNGFFVSEDGLALSDYSLFKGAERAVVITADGKQMPVDVILGANDMYDVIKFRVAITEKKVPALNVAKAAPEVGADAWMLPYSTQKSIACVSGKVKDVSKVAGEFHFPWLAANAIDTRTGAPYFKPYTVLHRKGLKIAVLGMITPGIPKWLPQHLWDGIEFEDMIGTARKWVPLIQEKEHPDLLIGLFHAGYNYNYAGENKDTPRNENATMLVARQVEGFDIIVSGHDHQEKVEEITNDAGHKVLIVDARSHARALGKITVSLTRHAGHYDKTYTAELIDPAKAPRDTAYLRKFTPALNQVKAYIDTPIGEFTETLSGREGLFGPSAFTDFIHNAQLRETRADVSFSTVLQMDAKIAQGEITIRDMFNLYKYENGLYLMKFTGQEIDRYLEYAYQLQYNTMTSAQDHLLNFKKDEQGNIVRNPKGHYVLAADYFNYSCAAGIKYTVDVSRQPGNRVEIHSLSDGRPFHADSTYTVAINSYRGNGGGGHLTQGVGWTKADINQRILKIWDKDVRYYITEYIKEKKVLTPRCRNDWKVIPEAWFQAGKKRDYKIMYESH